VNVGAMEQIVHHGKGLLPVGIINIEGSFQAGDVVLMVSEHGDAFAKGLVSYSADELRRIAGLRTSQVASVLGYKPADEVIHRDNLVLL
ncbi:MAG TPA: glutamate 5-kinase, partial [Armatimonadetes bacterium]|nr:glutamate 5-kinase [Armatimonadota bacterium]